MYIYTHVFHFSRTILASSMSLFHISTTQLYNCFRHSTHMFYFVIRCPRSRDPHNRSTQIDRSFAWIFHAFFLSHSMQHEHILFVTHTIYVTSAGIWVGVSDLRWRLIKWVRASYYSSKGHTCRVCSQCMGGERQNSNVTFASIMSSRIGSSRCSTTNTYDI